MSLERVTPPRPLEYRSPSPEMLAAPADGAWSLVYGATCAATMVVFYELHAVSPLDPVVFLTFPLVSAVPILGLIGVARGVDAIGLRRQAAMGATGLVLSLVSLGMLVHTLAHP